MNVYLVMLASKDGFTLHSVVAAYANQSGADELARDYNSDRKRLYGDSDPCYFKVECRRLRDS